MDKRVTGFLERLSQSNSPAFLMLGQRTLAYDAKHDIFLDAILSRYEFDNKKSYRGYSKIFDSVVNKDLASARAWISERGNLLTVPSWLEKVAQYAWSGLYTSTIDGMLNRAFRAPWRIVQPLYSSALQPIDPRNRAHLHLTYLFGGIDREDVKQTAPLTFLELKRREPDVATLLQRIPEQLTPVGILAIEAYGQNDDWLSPEKLYPVLMALEPGQAYMFSAQPKVLEDEYFCDAIAAGKLIVLSESLTAVLAHGIEAGILPLGQDLGIGAKGHQISLGTKLIPVPEHHWSQVSRFGVILDEVIDGRVPKLSPEKKYTAFRSFLAESGTHPVWAAHVQNLPFERDFERDVFLRLKRNLTTTAFDSDPIILHGQTGAGKTIALANIALRIKQTNQVPVIFIARRSQRFNHADLDSFCQWAEEAGFGATLLVWDGMQDIDQYYVLHKYLMGRGRKVVIVGSTYKLDESKEARANLVLAHAGLSKSTNKKLFDRPEVNRFKDYLASFEPSLGEKLEGVIDRGDSSFLVALYRLLPDTRGQVRAGLNLETGVAAVALRSNADGIKPDSVPVTILQAALEKVGLFKPAAALHNEQHLIAGEWVSAEQEFIGLIMVPGKFGLQVPIEILLRSLSSTAVTDFSKLINGIDLFRWSEDNQNNISIGARHALEAKLISQTRLGGAQAEVEYAKKLIMSVRRGQNSFDTSELQFASEFVRSLGPNGPEGKLYIDQYIEIADTLNQVRMDHGVKSPRLMLQEASLLREAIVLDTIDLDEWQPRIDVLKRAEQVLQEAIEDIGGSPRNVRLKSMLYVELASTHGAIAREFIRANRPLPDILVEFGLARQSAMRAKSLMPEDYFPIDVIAWSTKDLLTYAELDSNTRLEVIASIFNTFAMADGDDINKRDREKLEGRRMEFAKLLSDDALLEKSLKALEEMGSTIGYYLQAVTIAGGVPSADEVMDAAAVARYENAANYLAEHSDAIRNDAKCQYLYLRYWWGAKSGLSFYPDERTCLPFDGKQWSHVLSILENLIALDGEYENPFLIYLQAICKWQLGYYDDALAIWGELQRISDRVTGRRRIMKTYLASSSDGVPLTFNGTVAYVADDGSKGEVFVEKLRKKISFFPKEFGREEIRRDEQLSDFHIAFNYIAPTADHIRHYKSGNRS
ncbi:hypothetical protein HF313_23065 [Massilia atriviolacea]|uniref:Uncharacterized protein n=1 Tax=Massilia atriviolacea TaxID=2495579 RepID=A0A430HKN2_9BURK|nr:hypothetical protein [Massilia atriviolacea]RSZ58073.1 hypothetical protein EJB06_17425 [Massilia atriviolacea]